MPPLPVPITAPTALMVSPSVPLLIALIPTALPVTAAAALTVKNPAEDRASIPTPVLAPVAVTAPVALMVSAPVPSLMAAIPAALPVTVAALTIRSPPAV